MICGHRPVVIQRIRIAGGPEVQHSVTEPVRVGVEQHLRTHRRLRAEAQRLEPLRRHAERPDQQYKNAHHWILVRNRFQPGAQLAFGESLHVCAADGVLRRLHIQEADVPLSALRGCELRRGINPRLRHHLTVCVGLRVRLRRTQRGLGAPFGMLRPFAQRIRQ